MSLIRWPLRIPGCLEMSNDITGARLVQIDRGCFFSSSGCASAAGSRSCRSNKELSFPGHQVAELTEKFITTQGRTIISLSVILLACESEWNLWVGSHHVPPRVETCNHDSYPIACGRFRHLGDSLGKCLVYLAGHLHVNLHYAWRPRTGSWAPSGSFN